MAYVQKTEAAEPGGLGVHMPPHFCEKLKKCPFSSSKGALFKMELGPFLNEKGMFSHEKGFLTKKYVPPFPKGLSKIRFLSKDAFLKSQNFSRFAR